MGQGGQLTPRKAPDSLVELMQHVVQAAVELLRDPLEATFVGEETLVQQNGVRHGLILQRPTDAPQPVLLLRRPCTELLDGQDRPLDACRVGHQQVAQCSLPDVADNVLGDVCIARFAIGLRSSSRPASSGNSLPVRSRVRCETAISAGT